MKIDAGGLAMETNSEMDDSPDTKLSSPITEEERLKLAEKLDQELDEFIGGLEKRSYTEGWPEDRWQEEMEKHPFFMTKPPEGDQPLSPFMEGLQQLKFDETENSPEELAATYKEDGNFHFKLKKYRMAILGYTEGLRQKCTDFKLNSQLYNNRSAAHFFLKNYRSCLGDCRAALALQDDYPKARFRAAQCCFHLAKYDKCISTCDEILLSSPADKETKKLRDLAIASEKTEKLSNIKKEMMRGKNSKETVLKAIVERGIKFEPFEFWESSPCVHFVDDRLVWPVTFLYPEYKTSDFIEKFQEDSTFVDHLCHMFEEFPDWDLRKEYIPDKLKVYWEERDKQHLHILPIDNTLNQALAHPRFLVIEGHPCFFIVVENSKADQELLLAYTLV